jgi:uncharacterized protein (TIRG00374 family)
MPPTISRAFTKRRLAVLVGLSLGSFFAFLAFRGIQWRAVGDQLAGISVWAVAAAVALMLLSGYLRALRWRLLFVDEHVTAVRLFVVEHAALGLNNVSPIRLLDEPVIITILTLRDRIPAAHVLATIVMTRVQDVSVTLLFAAIAIAAEPVLASLAGPAVFAAVVFIGVLLGLLNLGRLSKRFGIIRRIPGIEGYAQAVSALLSSKPRLALNSSLTAAYWVVLGPMAYVLARSMGVEISLFQATIVALGAIFFATAAPGLPGAVGTFELAVVEMTGLWGVPRSLGVGYGLVLHLILFAPPVLFALVVLPREGISFLGRDRTRSGPRREDL